MKMQRSSLVALSLAATIAMPMTASADEPLVSVTVSHVSCHDGAASLTLTLTNQLLTENGDETVFAAEYSVDGGSWSQLAVWSAAFDGYDEPVINVGDGSIDAEFDLTFAYRLRLGPEDGYFVPEQTVENPCIPTSRADCREGSYADFGFDKQRDCYAFLRA